MQPSFINFPRAGAGAINRAGLRGVGLVCSRPIEGTTTRTAVSKIRMTSSEAMGNESSTKGTTIISWNVNSLRALLRKNRRAIADLVEAYDVDVLCLQETKLQEQHEKQYEDLLQEQGFQYSFFNSSSIRLGYSGTCVFTRTRPICLQKDINDDVGDAEGRVVMLEYDHLHLVNVYTMNSGMNFKRLPARHAWDKAFKRVLRTMRVDSHGGECTFDYGIPASVKPVVVVGDLNVAHTERDVFDEQVCRDMPGRHPVEVDAFDDLLQACDLVDVFRQRCDDSDKFTYWDYRTYARAHNRGMRIDYALVTRDMVNGVKDFRILDHVEGSDHCPILITLHPGFV